MKILSWNVRGLNAPNKQRVIKRRILLVSAEIIFLQETKLDNRQAVAFGGGISPLFMTTSQLTVDLDGASGGLMIIWRPSQVKVFGIASNRNWILAKVVHFQSNSKEQLFIGGDFNAI